MKLGSFQVILKFLTFKSRNNELKQPNAKRSRNNKKEKNEDVVESKVLERKIF